MTIASYVRSVFDVRGRLEDRVAFGATFAVRVAAFFDVFGMSGGPSLGVEQRGAGDDRIEIVVAMVDRHLELDPRSRRGPVERHARERDVALEHRRIHLA